MPPKYHVPIETTPPRFKPIGKYSTIEFREDCAGSCRECVKKKCVYDVFKENYQHQISMKEPEYLYTCQSCFRCVQECTKGIFSRVINPQYRTLGDDYWRADIIHRLWYQAHTGKVPVSGAGYRGPFVGPGFDAMWTDMSEIVRPTRDGIHGREYINTSIELSRRLTPLAFNSDMRLIGDPPPILELPIPLLFQMPETMVNTPSLYKAAARAAGILGTMMFIRPEDYTKALDPYAENLIPRITRADIDGHIGLVRKSKMVEIRYEPGVEHSFSKLRKIRSDLAISVLIPLNADAVTTALTLANTGADTLHFYADEHGYEPDAPSGRFLKEMIREVHLGMVNDSCRQKINLIFSGGIAMAEHMAKAIICGADGVAVDCVLLVALECRFCHRCRQGLSCPVQLDKEIDPVWGSRRIINLVGAWHGQLIEVMGAMGIREARRLRGEVGRSMWFEDMEKDIFSPLFGERKASGLI
ncbi:MAG: glutamate synthase-related protein [Pseudomonadota bacterium]